MIELKKGEVYVAERARKGESGRGDWELITIKEKNKAAREVTIWVDNIPANAYDGCKFKITDISYLKYSSRKDSQGKWYDNVSIGASIEVIPPDPSLSFELNNPFIEDDGPFDNSDLPFDINDDTLPL